MKKITLLMKYLKISYCICFFVTTSLFAQTKEITLEDIWNGSFRTEHMDVLHSMASGQQYSVLNFNMQARFTSVDVYDYKTSKKVKTLVDSRNVKELNYFSDYVFSDDEGKIMLATNESSIYRHSTVGHYYVYNIEDKSVIPISDTKIQEPTFSPDGTKVAYGYNNNLYVKDLHLGEVTQITFDGEKNKIINGITDWVYEEEFAFVRAFEWNADGTKIAFIRFDEAHVPEFSMDVYGADLYQTQQVFKYPKAGEANALVSLHIYDLKTNGINDVKVNKAYKDSYIPRIKWTNNPNVLSAQYINRHQNELGIWMINGAANTSNLVLTETDKAYIDITVKIR